MRNAAYQNKLVVRTKLSPPRPHKHTLRRPRLTERLLEAVDYRLTIVHAGTGYGKSTALAALADETHPLIWYHLDAEDADPLVFLLHLLHGFDAALPAFSEAPLAHLEEWERSGGDALWGTVVDMLVSELADHGGERVPEHMLLIIDDAHVLNEAAQSLRILDRLAGRAPANLHLILSTRYPMQLPTLVTWRVRGEVLEIGQSELAFSAEETVALFRDRFDYALSERQVDLLMDQIEGWPIALPLVWQRLQSGDDLSLNQALGKVSGASGNLFSYLAQEVLAQQPADVRRFLRATSVLREMTTTACDCLRQAQDSEQLLRYLHEHGLFVVGVGDGHVRYHHLFRDLLLHTLSPERRRALHRRAAACARRQEREEAAVYHLLEAEAYEEAAELLERLGRKLVRSGRLDRLARWLGSLPPAVLQMHPPLLVYLGDVARLHSRFEEALGWYEQAQDRSQARGDARGTGQALRGQARVYLDTVNPSKAERLLQEALRLSDGQEDRESRARLLELLAENLLNQGKLEQAQAYQAEVRALRERSSAPAELSTRVLLRTGRLDEARRRLEERAEAERQDPVLRPRAHRETLLLLSLIYAFQGERESAYRCALEGTQRGEQFDSPFVTAVGYMRQGHAWLLDKDEDGYEQARACFQEAIAISERLQVPRLKVEASWGLCQAYGFPGEIEMARKVAEQGIAIARDAGDEWVEACIRVTLGASYALAGEEAAAAEWLDLAATAFRACPDTYGETVVRLWQCLLWHAVDDKARLERDVDTLLQLVRDHGYAFLFRRKTLLSPPDPRALIPLLLFARDHGRQAPYAGRLLRRLDLAQIEIHPGYRLRVQTLGQFRLWRGRQEVPAQEWTRQKARQLFQLMLTYGHTLLEREQMAEMLWPELDPEAALRDFKIAYSALNRVLQPERRRNAPSAYVVREGSRYGLRPEADLWLDAACFDERVAAGDELWGQDRPAALDHYRHALDLYQGEYLQEYPYEEWTSEERERLLTRYLRTAERVATALLEEEAWEDVIGVCGAILARDDCWESAYRMMMVAYARQGNRAQALRTYRRCVDRLQAELGVEPGAVTQQTRDALSL